LPETLLIKGAREPIYDFMLFSEMGEALLNLGLCVRLVFVQHSG